MKNLIEGYGFPAGTTISVGSSFLLVYRGYSSMISFDETIFSFVGVVVGFTLMMFALSYQRDQLFNAFKHAMRDRLNQLDEITNSVRTIKTEFSDEVEKNQKLIDQVQSTIARADSELEEYRTTLRDEVESIRETGFSEAERSKFLELIGNFQRDDNAAVAKNMDELSSHFGRIDFDE